ncbi:MULTISPECIES: hypothetical protein [unclassified Synechococcus]|uniref:hypothetical protein n=1 Tax=unclassified Synechococcus TaxID=2626047 RepID=UPI0021A85574|nr:MULTISPECIES: hypothetical protein [unclassified Synechococcus]MCT0232882.1 hypothetical protein [Synechococcus sp. CS-1327]
MAIALLIGFIALQLHAPLAAEEALSDLGPASLLEGLLKQAPDGRALLALAGEFQDFPHLMIREIVGHFQGLRLHDPDFA